MDLNLSQIAFVGLCGFENKSCANVEAEILKEVVRKKRQRAVRNFAMENGNVEPLCEIQLAARQFQ